MRNIVGQAVVGDDLFGREWELAQLWERIERGEHILMVAPRRVGTTSLMLELHHQRREGWDAVYVDLQSGDSAEYCIAAILARLAGKPHYRTWIEEIPFRQSLASQLGEVRVNAPIDTIRVDIERAIAGDWKHAAEQLFGRLADPPTADRRLLIMLDEFPVLVSQMLKAAARGDEVEPLLSRLREMRQVPDLRNRVHTLIGGSVSLGGVLRRAGLSRLIDDLYPFRLESWDRPTAIAFLSMVGSHTGFPLGEERIHQILDLLWDPVPYHLQLFFSAIRGACKGDPDRVSAPIVEQCFRDRLAGTAGTAFLDHYAERLETILTEAEHAMATALLDHACRSEAGAEATALEGERRQDEATFRSVLRVLEDGGYLVTDDGAIRFRSNLVRVWWKCRPPTGVTR